LYGQKNNIRNEKNLTNYSQYGSGFDSENKVIRNNQRYMMYFFQQVCTFKSARDGNLRDWFEVLNELIAQYLTTGKIKFKPAPRCIGGGSGANKINLCTNQLDDVNDYLDMLERDLEFLLDNIMSGAVNRVLVM
jgi:hypothetical protein